MFYSLHFTHQVLISLYMLAKACHLKIEVNALRIARTSIIHVYVRPLAGMG